MWRRRAGRDRRRRQAYRGAGVQGVRASHRQEHAGRYLHAGPRLDAHAPAVHGGGEVKRLRIPTTVVDAPTATSRDGTIYYLLTSDQVPGIDGRVVGSGYVHVGCPLHGSDHQPSLHIQVMDADRRGFGRCHSCTKQVLVTDLNAEAAAHLTGKARGFWQPRRVTAEALLRPPRRPAVSDPTPEPWQRDELATLERLAERMRPRLPHQRARAYLAQRHIPHHIAPDARAGY